MQSLGISAASPSTHQCFAREDLQQRDQVMSISKVFIQVCHVTLCLPGQKESTRHKKSKCNHQELQYFINIHPFNILVL